MNWYLKVLKNYFGFTGRARRKEFWMFFLFNFLITIVLTIIDLAIGVRILSLIYGLAVLIPGIALTIRRLHDVGKSGWFYLLLFVPLANIYILILMFIDSQPGENQYGPNPKEGEIIA